MSRPMQPFSKIPNDKQVDGDYRPRLGTPERKKGEPAPKGSRARESAKYSQGEGISRAETGRLGDQSNPNPANYVRSDSSPSRPRLGNPSQTPPTTSADEKNSGVDTGPMPVIVPEIPEALKPVSSPESQETPATAEKEPRTQAEIGTLPSLPNQKNGKP